MRAPTARAQGPSRPALIQALIDAFRVPDLRARILFTLVMLVVFRFLAHVPVINIDRGVLSNIFQGNQLLGFLDLFSGGGMRNLSIVALGVYPYITASIVMNLMTPVIPRLQALAKEGEQGRQRMNQITHYLMIPIALAQGYAQLSLMQRLGGLAGTEFTGGFGFLTMTMVISMTAGTVFLVWLGELITERGIGNGVSIIIFAGIVAQFPQITLADVYAALAYYHDHREEIQESMQQDEEFAAAMRAKTPSKLIRKLTDAHAGKDTLPPG